MAAGYGGHVQIDSNVDVPVESVTMRTELRRIANYVSIVVCLLFVLFVVNQTAQVVDLANTVSPTFGQAVLYGLLVVYALLLLVPAVIFARLPRALRPPSDELSPEFDAYLRKLAARLTSNPHLAEHDLVPDDRQSIEDALDVLEEKAMGVIQTAASTVFVSTAVSQSGRLDAIMVLVAQSRMITQIAQVYYQRPTLGELIRLYANVGATTFFVREIEDLDIAEQIEPIVAATLSGSLAGAVPGVSVVASLVTSSILEGTANAYLTLRVGAIARQYCSALTQVNRGLARRSASVEAASMLGSIVVKSAATVTKSIVSAAKKAGADSVGSVVEGVSRGTREFAQKMGATVNRTKQADQLDDGEIPETGEDQLEAGEG